MMPSPKQKLVADWLLKARHDIASAERLMQPEPILDTADGQFSALVDQCEILTPYGTEFRYPGSELQPEPEEALAALAMAREVFEMVEQLIWPLREDHD